MERSLGEGEGEESGDGSIVFLEEDWDLLCFFFFIMVTYLWWMIFFFFSLQGTKPSVDDDLSSKQGDIITIWIRSGTWTRIKKKSNCIMVKVMMVQQTCTCLFISFTYGKLRSESCIDGETKVLVQFLILNDWFWKVNFGDRQ